MSLVVVTAFALLGFETPGSGSVNRPAPAPVSKQSRALAFEAFPRLIGSNDYPRSALKAGEQGVVHFAFDVSPRGRVTRCDVFRSSGSAALDAATCRLVRKRARFRPARDAEGKPVPDTLKSWLAWRIAGSPSVSP